MPISPKTPDSFYVSVSFLDCGPAGWRIAGLLARRLACLLAVSELSVDRIARLQTCLLAVLLTSTCWMEASYRLPRLPEN